MVGNEQKRVKDGGWVGLGRVSDKEKEVHDL